jgi:TonB family protein
MRSPFLRFAVLGALGLSARAVAAQQPARTDSTRCDSVVASAKVDSVMVTLSIRAFSLDGSGFTTDDEELLTTVIGSEFVPPRPFRLSVFSPGGPTTQTLRAAGPRSGLRAPTVTGVYRFLLHDDGTVSDLYIARLSLIRGFDSAVVIAISGAAQMNALPRPTKTAKQTQIELRLTTDSLPGGRALSVASFPRMPVVDAAAKPNNPVPEYPEAEKRDSVEGNVVLRFIVDRLGEPITETAMVVRGTTRGFVMAAIATLPTLRFTPATIGGCAVAQVVEYPFNFILPRGDIGLDTRGRTRH